MLQRAHKNADAFFDFNLAKTTRDQSDLAKDAPNDPCAVEPSSLSRVTDRLMDGQTDTAHICNNSLHLMHSMQPKNA